LSTGSAALGESVAKYQGQHDAAAQDAICATILDRSGTELDAFAAASASRCATSKESFRTAKSKVIERFERAYITAALGRHSGNIAMAARAAQKHRRAFWALMRKHEIDAAPFRCEPAPTSPRDG
jgi:DNA-binding NtrC family response regulator